MARSNLVRGLESAIYFLGRTIAAADNTVFGIAMNAGRGMSATMGLAIAAPSASRYTTRNIENYRNGPEALTGNRTYDKIVALAGFGIGLSIGTYMNFLMAEGLMDNLESGGHLCTIPLVTQLASGTYEIFRREKNQK